MSETVIDKMSFEDALAELEKIVSQLERGDAPLEQSIELYGRGAKLKTHCENLLKKAQLKVEKIVLAPDGSANTQPFDEA